MIISDMLYSKYSKINNINKNANLMYTSLDLDENHLLCLQMSRLSVVK